MIDSDDDFSDTISVNTTFTEDLITDVVKKLDEDCSILESLPKKMSNFHPSVLFYRCGPGTKSQASYNAWQSLTIGISCCIQPENTWKSIGEAYGVSRVDLESIESSASKVCDQVDCLLKLLSLIESTRLDKLLEVLVEHQKYDVLDLAQQPLLKLKEEFELQDDGYYSFGITYTSSNNTNDTQRTIRIDSEITESIINDIPICLKRFPFDSESNGQNKLPFYEPLTKDSDSLVLFLTYAEDGADLAGDIKRQVDSWRDFPKEVLVWTLSDNYGLLQDSIFACRGLYDTIIKDYCNQADLIVPIVTEGYMNEIERVDSSLFTTTNNLDFKYVHYIYKLISNEFLINQCKNKKVRSVIADGNESIVDKMCKHLVLKPWTEMNHFDMFFKAFLNKIIRERRT